MRQLAQTSKEQKKTLRSIAHERKTIIWVGQQGLSKNILDEADTALDHHELIKIKIRVGDREQCDELTNTLCAKTSAELVQKIGNVITVFRQNKKDPKIKLAT